MSKRPSPWLKPACTAYENLVPRRTKPMTDDPTTTTPPPGGQPQALTAEREADLRADHQCSDVDTWCRAAGCKQDWPCATAQLLAALDEARSEVMRLQDNDSAYALGYQRADAAAGAALERLRQECDEARDRASHFESLATDQQATNAAMVASLRRGLAELRASEAECTRLRNVLINTRRNDGHWYGCWTNDGSSERCSPECALFAETLAATDRGRAPAGEAHGRTIAGTIAAQALQESLEAGNEISVPALGITFKKRADAPPCHRHVGRDPYCATCNPIDAPPAPADQARREGPDDEPADVD